jgi:hypothetical protein
MNFHGSIGVVTCLIGNIDLARGELQDALENYCEAFELALKSEEVSDDWLFATCLSYLAILQRKVGNKELAIELATLTHNQPKLHPYMKSKMNKLLAELEEGMPQEEFIAAQERGRARDLLATAEEMLELLDRGDVV